jgi:hypothetical protein
MRIKLNELLYLLIAFNIANACDCSGQIVYAFSTSANIMSKEYAKLNTQLQALDKQIIALSQKIKKENLQLDRILLTEQQKNLKVAKLKFYIQKIAQKSALTLQSQQIQSKEQINDIKQNYYQIQDKNNVIREYTK